MCKPKSPAELIMAGRLDPRTGRAIPWPIVLGPDGREVESDPPAWSRGDFRDCYMGEIIRPSQDLDNWKYRRARVRV